MHELGIVFYIIRDVKKAALENAVEHVSAVVMNIGEVSTVVPELLADCWHWASDREPLLRGCELKVNTIPAITRCDNCGEEYETVRYGRPDAPVLRHRLPDLEKMLWGGTLMLIVDHVINGELTWRFPFFTALDQAGGGMVMLREMLTVGVPMSLVLTAAWLVWVLVKSRKTATIQ